MYVCVCTGLDEKSLKEMSDQGTDTLSKVIKKCGAGGDCGTCAFKINRILKEHNSIKIDQNKEANLKTIKKVGAK